MQNIMTDLFYQRFLHNLKKYHTYWSPEYTLALDSSQFEGQYRSLYGTMEFLSNKEVWFMTTTISTNTSWNYSTWN